MGYDWHDGNAIEDNGTYIEGRRDHVSSQNQTAPFQVEIADRSEGRSAMPSVGSASARTVVEETHVGVRGRRGNARRCHECNDAGRRQNGCLSLPPTSLPGLRCCGLRSTMQGWTANVWQPKAHPNIGAGGNTDTI
jgi:hypothetical protein